MNETSPSRKNETAIGIFDEILNVVKTGERTQGQAKRHRFDSIQENEEHSFCCWLLLFIVPLFQPASVASQATDAGDVHSLMQKPSLTYLNASAVGISVQVMLVPVFGAL
ncbi:MAG: hypothetical protein RIR26_1548 [Pseudomonadota bacterium]|jgi:hypothetical protein